MQGYNNTLGTCELTTPGDRGINHLWSCDTGFCYAARGDDKPYIIVFCSHYALSSTCRRRRLIAFRIIVLFSFRGYTCYVDNMARYEIYYTVYIIMT